MLTSLPPIGLHFRLDGHDNAIHCYSDVSLIRVRPVFSVFNASNMDLPLLVRLAALARLQVICFNTRAHLFNATLLQAGDTSSVNELISLRQLEYSDPALYTAPISRLAWLSTFRSPRYP